MMKTKSEKNLTKKLQKIVGVVKLPKDFDEKKELKYYFENKHLNKKQS